MDTHQLVATYGLDLEEKTRLPPKLNPHQQENVLIKCMDAKFESGGWVEFVTGFQSPRGRFRIVRPLPVDQGEPTYRVKGEGETFERVARESQLRGVANKGDISN
ncbi:MULTISPECIES: hypothetical protein [unclassified Xanthobacter]|uniref:hypothetical protein n=1 Tax=unclassified Xanthobacter TaxID=2623496 RepID=UPI001F1864C3|nr:MULTISPECIES: hypothetical protein [unclassified Xanthobacter]